MPLLHVMTNICEHLVSQHINVARITVTQSKARHFEGREYDINVWYKDGVLSGTSLYVKENDADEVVVERFCDRLDSLLARAISTSVLSSPDYHDTGICSACGGKCCQYPGAASPDDFEQPLSIEKILTSGKWGIGWYIDWDPEDETYFIKPKIQAGKCVFMGKSGCELTL